MTLQEQTSAMIVGIDIGGTKTHLRAEPFGGGAARDLVLPSGEWRVREWGQDAARLLGLVTQLLDGASAIAIGIGAHGCDSAEECMTYQNEFASRSQVPLKVVNDAELMPLALNLPEQIGVVAGTGSIAVCRRATGELLTAGGWGWVVGDEGSAASLVREAVRAVAHHFDRGGARGEPLVEAILDTLKVPAIPRLGSVLAGTLTAAEVGHHATVVFEAADAGSTLADHVIRDGGRTLANLVALLNDRGAAATAAVAGGSVIASQPRLWNSFVKGLSDLTADSINPHLFTGKPVEGACRLAINILENSRASETNFALPRR